MSLKSIARQILPPIIYNEAKRRRNISEPFPDYESAAATCDGYNNPALARAYAWFTQEERRRIGARRFSIIEAKNLLAVQIAAEGKSRLHVIDFGGACGIHYYSARSFLPMSLRLDWHVIETEAMVQAGRDEQHPHELEFHESWEDALSACPDTDLVFSSSALHCMARPLDCLHEHMAAHARFIFITRIGLSDRAPVYGVQARTISKGIGKLPPGMTDIEVRYPLVFSPRKYFEGVLQEEYTIRYRLDEEQPIFIVGDERIDGYGCLAERR